MVRRWRSNKLSHSFCQWRWRPVCWCWISRCTHIFILHWLLKKVLQPSSARPVTSLRKHVELLEMWEERGERGVYITCRSSFVFMVSVIKIVHRNVFLRDSVWHPLPLPLSFSLINISIVWNGDNKSQGENSPRDLQSVRHNVRAVKFI